MTFKKNFPLQVLLIFILGFFLASFSGCTGKPTAPSPSVPTSPAKVELQKIPVRGDQGPDVVELQKALNRNGSTLKEDGDFGGVTETAISVFQKKFGLSGTGVLGPKTMDLLGLVVKGSTSAEPAPSPGVEPTGLKLAWAGKHKDADKWTAMLMESLSTLGKDMTAANPLDAENFCPKYRSLDLSERREFYAQLISKMTQFESSYNPASFMYECNKKKNPYGSDGRWDEARGWCMKGGHTLDGGYVISRGLMQMSIESAQGYHCDIKVPQDLHDPAKNLACAVRIMNRFIPAPRQYEGAVRGHGSVAGYSATQEKWLGAAAYWAVIRDRSDSESYPSIRAYTRGLAICK